MARREFVRWIGGGAACVALGGAGSRPSPRHRTWRLSAAFLDGLDDRLASAGVPALAIGLGDGDGPTAVHYAGRSAGPDGVFMAASLSKPVLATIAIRAHAAGAFDLDRPMGDYLSDDLPTGEGAEQVTPRLCLAHASGLPNWRYTVESLVVAYPPGTGWRYSGEGYVLVQRALERHTGRGLERLAREFVFEPTGMTSSSYLVLPRLADLEVPPFVPPEERFADYAALIAWKERAVVQYAADTGRDPADLRLDELRRVDGTIAGLAADLAGRTFPEPAAVPNFLVPNAAGSLRTTARDYARFLASWLHSDDLRSVAFEAPVARDDGLAWGLGWGLEGRTGGADAAFWHWGETLGVRTFAYADPVRDGAFVGLTNASGGMDVIEAAFDDATGGRPELFDAI